MELEVFNIRPSTREYKKYAADVAIGNKMHMNVHFGDVRYQQYRDSTPLKLWSHLDHNDPKRRAAYLSRHGKDKGPAGLLAKKYLW